MRILLLLLLAFSATAQRTHYKFDFGSARTVKGWIPITPDSLISWKRGYGLHERQTVSIERSGSHKLTDDYINSKYPFYFSFRVPEGNYDIKVIMPPGRGRHEVRVECRRQMAIMRQRAHKPVVKAITVHVRDSVIRDRQGTVIGQVKLKPRERKYLHWDAWLTMDFDGRASAIEVKPNTRATTIFLAGNSTVVDQANEPYASWGQMMPAFFKPGSIAIANYAESGETMKAFKAEGRLEKIFSMAKPGDYLFIEFAHNDQKPGGNYLDPFTTYKQTLKEWIAAARHHQMIPVLVTSTHRRSFNSFGEFVNTLGDYPEAMRQTAKEDSVALIDLNAMSETLIRRLGSTSSRRAFVHYPANTYAHHPGELKDDTHFNPYGAYEIARCVAKGIMDARLPIGKYLYKKYTYFNPRNPDWEAEFGWRESWSIDAEQPDGN